MNIAISPLATSIIISLSLTASSYAETITEDIEQITVIGERSTERVSIVETEIQHPDVSDTLKLIAGANVNKNGALTGIVQYRGLYGDRIATKVGGQTMTGAGPNAMDTPLSYSPTIITENIIMQRGIASVTTGIESLGGAVNTKLTQAEFANSSASALSGKLQVGFQDNGKQFSQGGLINIGTENAAFMAYLDHKSADDLTTADGRKISPSGYDKTQAGLSSSVNFSDSIIGFSYHYNDTQNAGTPSLPMDIDFIFAHRTQLFGQHNIADGKLNWQLGFVDADHKMDNFEQRMNMMPTMFRQNHAEAEAISFALDWKNEHLTIGVDGYRSTHDATITNPNNMMFNIKNFSDVEDQKLSVFSEYQLDNSGHTIKFGARVKHISADAGKVSHHMAMMNPTINALVMAFNQADRHQTDVDTDLTLDWLLPTFNNSQFQLSIAQKQRAPSYQERYLWLPMEATAGLADGNTYLGNIALNSESAKQINVGFTHQNDNIIVIADAFYSRIDDYIQGTPNTNVPINMLAKMMMNSDTVLQFANVEAQLSGFDGQIIYQLNNHWQISSTISYVRGKRKDIDDNLYRVAPLNGHIALSYQYNDWDISARFHAVAKQQQVAMLNNEQKTAGYGFIDFIASYQIATNLVIKAGISNVLDREYQDHLTAYNRVNGSEISPMARIPSTARNAWLNINYQF